MFYSDYKTKNTSTLIEIVNSDSYQLNARETAKQILEERGETDFISSEKEKYQKLSVYELVSKLETYNLNIEISKKQESFQIKKDNNGFITGIILLILGIVVLFLTIFLVVIIPREITLGKGYAGKYGYIATFFCVTVGLNQLRLDRMNKIRIDYKAGEIETTTRQRQKKENKTYLLSETNLIFRRTESKSLSIIAIRNGVEHIAINFKDNNVKDKTDQLIEELNEKIKNGC